MAEKIVPEKTRVMVVDPDARRASEAARLLWSAFVVDTAGTAEGALLRLRDFNPDALLCPAEGLEEGFCQKVKRASRHCSVVLAFDRQTKDAEQRAQAAGADAWVPLPFEAGALVSCMRLGARVAALGRQVDELRGRVDEKILAPWPNAGQTQQFEVEFFKRLLLMEVKRSQRYRYPLALLTVGFDKFAATLGRLRVHERTSIVAKSLAVVNELIRDIDLAVQDGEERFLVCLPQTDLDGAQYVAGRLRERIPTVADKPRFTVSVGVAAYDGSGDDVTFKALHRQASECLKRAQALGGDRVDAIPGPMAPR